MIGMIRVVTLEKAEDINQHPQIIEKRYGLSIKSVCTPDQYNEIHSDETEATAVPKIIELGKKLNKQGCTFLIISCADDLVIEKLRIETKLFVIGARSSSALVACSTGKKKEVIDITTTIPTVVK